jgi:transcriptional regulator with XRE-family HTH domain
MTKASIIAQLKARRLALGWTLADVASRMGRSDKNLRSVVSQWERGAKVPDDDTLARWAMALGCEYHVTRELTVPDASPPAPSPDK